MYWYKTATYDERIIYRKYTIPQLQKLLLSPFLQIHLSRHHSDTSIKQDIAIIQVCIKMLVQIISWGELFTGATSLFIEKKLTYSLTHINPWCDYFGQTWDARSIGNLHKAIPLGSLDKLKSNIFPLHICTLGHYSL